MASSITSPPGAPPALGTGLTNRDFSDLRRDGIGPIILATMGVEFDPTAADFAVDAAVESGLLLIVANVLILEATPVSLLLGYSNVLGDPPDLAASLRAPAVRAYALGAQVERVRIRTPHRVAALLEFVAERNAALLVFGPDPRKLPRRLYRKACKAVRDRAPCLVWTNEP
jgi:Universal stress protein family